MTVRTDAQLQRLLAAFPLMEHDPDLTLSELAARVGTDAATLRRDFAMLDREALPPGWVQAVEVHIGARGVSMRSSHFKVPMRLTRPEVAALELGLSLLQQELPVEEREGVARVRALLGQLAVPEVTTVVDRWRGGDAEAVRAPALAAEAVPAAARPGAEAQLAAFGVLHQALEARCTVTLHYRAAGQGVPQPRPVRPYALVRAHAHVYLVAHCEQAGALRVFRLDRVAGAQLREARFVIPPDFSVESVLREGRVFVRDHPVDEELVVRYAPGVARWIAERERVPVEADGSVVVRYPLADRDWAVRHVLQYGGDAVVLSPPALQAAVLAVLDGALDGALEGAMEGGMEEGLEGGKEDGVEGSEGAVPRTAVPGAPAEPGQAG
jgi:proteasome accessory factor C